MLSTLKTVGSRTKTRMTNGSPQRWTLLTGLLRSSLVVTWTAYSSVSSGSTVFPARAGETPTPYFNFTPEGEEFYFARIFFGVPASRLPGSEWPERGHNPCPCKKTGQIGSVSRGQQPEQSVTGNTYLPEFRFRAAFVLPTNPAP